MLRNPAYKGTACFGKTKAATRQRITRPLRLRGGIAARDSTNHQRSRNEWIEIPVPAIVSVTAFALAEERLQDDKKHGPRRTMEPSVSQGIVSCAKCSYALYRTSTRSSARTIHYYHCLGSDARRRLGGPVDPTLHPNRRRPHRRRQIVDDRSLERRPQRKLLLRSGVIMIFLLPRACPGATSPCSG